MSRPTRAGLVAGVAAVIAALAFVDEKSWTTTSLPQAGAQPTSSSTVARTNSPYPSDERGFVNSSARCEAPWTAAAIVRTDGSVVVICADQKHAYQYRGVRLSDGATMSIPAESAGAPREFVAHNDAIEYQLGTSQLVITSDNTLIRRETVIEYKEPQSFSAEIPPVSTSSPTPSTARPPS